MQSKFTAEASQFWQALPDEHKQALIANVWCGSCSEETTIVDFSGKMERGNLILEGECRECRGPVGRLVEGG